ncbi:uncharacterized protein PV09_01077 [Verruconis gallopava]|uniref:Carrier domain-containing protein n=1 Tax=Verruconis gallopava TaxID=253628 RepID=A0A0D2ANP4_9PEZI|nr:uncharacterized protein PV09_01077 [Verruconis gallopava]KIW08145.1 hypothetical protein PV09_01077 [Verruconis gallopava]
MYTLFPYLLSRPGAEDDFQPTSIVFSNLQGSADELVWAWANVLSGYSGYDDQVSFVRNDSAMLVTLRGDTVQIEEVNKTEPIPREATAVYTDGREPLQNLALEIYVDLRTGCGALHTNGFVPAKHLSQVISVLQCAPGQTGNNLWSTILSSDPRVELSMLNERPTLVPGPNLLHMLVSSAQDGQSIAIDYYDADMSNVRVSYDELYARISNLEQILCERLAQRTVNQRRTIPILIPHSPELYIAMIAVLRSGCAFCPLQLDAPRDRLEFIVRDVGATVVITTSAYLSKAQSISDVDIIDANVSNSHINRKPSSGPKDIQKIDPSDTAYIMYTSGSTGKPKGVPVSHLSATQSLLAHDRHIPKFSRFLQFAAPTFDVSIFEIFFTLYRHSTLVVCERSRLLNDIPFAMRYMQVDAAELTPTVAGGLLQLRKNAPGLKLLLTIGEMLTPQVVAEFGGDESKDAILWGMYGPTEAAIHCTLQPAFSTRHKPGNIGFPLDTVSAFVIAQTSGKSQVEDVFQPLPQGFVGELAVGGFQLADGYLNRPEQTANAFIRTNSHGLIYRTGDKARILVDGTIECLGRISTGQVKLRGQRIELGEIRHAVAKTPGCLDAVVSVINESLVAFCLSNENLATESVMASCRSWLPSFMVPSDVVILQDFPRLQSGKVDMKELEQKYEKNYFPEAGRIENDTSNNAWLACKVLRGISRRSILPSQKLSSTGIDSLLAIKAASQLRRHGFRVSVTDLLGDKTIEELVQDQNLGGLSQSTESNIVNPNPPHPLFAEVQKLAAESIDSKLLGGAEQIYPCTALQLAMLAETVADPRNYCNWIELQIEQSLSLRRVMDLFRRLSSVHSMLRSGFCQLSSSKTPFACITYRELEDTQFSEVQDFNREFSWREDELLRPLQIQVKHEQDSCSILLQIHHSLYDGWSIDLLVRDLRRLLNDEVLAAMPGFVMVTNFYLNVDCTAALDYWQDQLSDFQPTRLPNFNGQVAKSAEVKEEVFKMSVVPKRVRQLAEELQVSKPAIFQTMTAYVLGTYLGSADVVLGTVTSGRSIPLAGIEDVFGPCLATSPLRIHFKGGESAAEACKRTNVLNRHLLEHAIVPLQTIKQVCDIEAGKPLWDVLFVWQESLDSHISEERHVHVVDSADKLECAVTLEFEPRDDGIFGKATFKNDIISSKQAVLLLQQIDSLVLGLIEKADASFAELCETLPLETLSISNPSPDKLLFDHGVEHAVEYWALTQPDHLALTFAIEVSQDKAICESLTYKQLNERANQLAHFLSVKDLKSSELVAICMEKSLDLYVAILAVLKLGLGYLPITPTTPLARIKKITDEAGVSLCLSQRQVFHHLPLESICEVLNIDTVDIARLSTANLETKYNGSRAAYAVFTSGSTGTPKGVLVTQNNLRSNLAVLAEIYPTANGDRLLQSCSQAFDVSVFEIFFAWQEGMCLCTATNDVLFKDIEMAIRALEITHLSLTPTVAALIHPDNVPSVRFLVTAGEGVTQKVKNMWSDLGLFQGYGPSETTNICTVKPNVTRSDAIRNIGPVFRNTSGFVFDPAGNTILPRGAVGELCFGGDQVFRGYINQPELTASRIVTHPKFGRLYRSGDSGRILCDDSILFEARLDDQVKIRGQRIELNEINHCILESADVADCATIFLEKEFSNPRLFSFIVPKDTSAENLRSDDGLLLPLEDEVLTWCNMVLSNARKFLPVYMVPSAIIPIARIPMTLQGKIDHRMLKMVLKNLERDMIIKLGGGETSSSSTEVREWPEKDKAILETLKEILGTSAVAISRGVSFLSLGLDSISAIPFARRLSTLLGRDVPVSAILRNPSIARLSQWMEGSPSNALSYSSPEFLLPQTLVEKAQIAAARAKVSVRRILPCTPLQEAMLSSSSQDSSMYLNVMYFDIRCDPDQLKECWRKMFDRHDLLRTTFLSTNDPDYPFLQIIRSHSDLPWKNETDFTARDLVEIPSALDTFIVPVQLTIFQNDFNNVLRLCCHHALYDGTAMALLLDDIERLYRGDNLLPIIDYSLFLREMVAQKSAEHINFWQSYLHDLQPAILRPKSRHQNFIRHKVANPLSLVEKSCRQMSVSLLAVFQTAFAKTLYSLFQTPDVCFGSVVSGRSVLSDHLDSLVASTFNTIPTRIQLQRHELNIDAMKAAQRSNATCMSHQLCALRSIQSKLGFTETGIFSSLLLLQSASIDLDPRIWLLENENGAMDFPLILELIPDKRNDSLVAILHYNTSILHSFEAEEVILHFLSVFDQCIEKPNFPTVASPPLSSQLSVNFSTKISWPNSVKLALEDSKPSNTMNETEKKILEIISEIFGISNIRASPTTSIYQLGIDSIGAIQLATGLRARGHSKITAAQVLQNPKIADLAALVSEQSHAAESSGIEFDLDKFSAKFISQACEINGLSLSLVEHLWPCTPVQMGLISQFLKDGKTYVNHITYSTNNDIPLDRVRYALEHLAREYEMLRTGFVAIEDDPRHSYGMVIFRAGVLELPVEIVPSSGFDLDAWREEKTKDFHEFLAKPSWAVCLQSASSELLMHVSIFHAIYDATSLDILLEALDAVMNGQEIPKKSPIKPILSNILNHSSLGSDNDNEHVTFWQQSLQEINHSRFPDLTPLRVSKLHTLSAEKVLRMGSQKLKEKCKSMGYSIQAVGQATWAKILSEYLGEDNICFGVVLSGRDMKAGADRAVFPCLTTVPFGISLTGNTNDQLVKFSMAFNSAVRKHQFCSLHDIQRWTGREALFDTIFAYQKTGTLSNNARWKTDNEIATDEFSLSMELIPTNLDDIIIRITFKDNLVPMEQARVILNQFETLLEELFDEPDTAVSEHAVSSSHILSITPAQEPLLDSPVELLHEFVELQANKNPDRVAFEFYTKSENGEFLNQSWSYKDLDREGLRVMQLLALHGVHAGSYVGICFDKCPEASFAILGVLKANCAYVAIDPSAPAARKSFIAQDAKLSIILSSNRQAKHLDCISASSPIIYLDEVLSEPVPDSIVATQSITSDSVCYCLYTSGTTGTPKGCEITHKNAVQAMRAFSKIFRGRWNERSKWLQFASFHFDVSVLEQYWSWSEGICVVSAPRDLIFEDIEAAIRTMGVTHIDLTPSLASLVQPANVPNLCKGIFITGGEQLKQEILDDWGEEEVIHNGYGPTETTIGVTMYPCVPKTGKPANIGPQFANVGTYVLRPGTNHPVLRGAVGELCVSGALVGKGYLNRPELTAERFPFLESCGERIYRTGDLVRICHDNTFLFLGRIDDQIKLRGQRLEIGEINSTIRKSVSGITDVATFVLRHPKQQRDQLTTFFAIGNVESGNEETVLKTRHGQEGVIEQIRAACREQLPGYMVPTFIIPVSRIPLSANNKTDAKTLKSLFCEMSLDEIQAVSKAECQSLNSTERKVAEILSVFCDIPTENIQPRSNIFELGLDSISVLGFCNKLRRSGFYGASPALVMSHPYIDALAKALLENSSAKLDANSTEQVCQRISNMHAKYQEEFSSVLRVQVDDIEAIAPCTPLQEGMISTFLGQEQNGAYFSTFTFKMRSKIELERIQKAWQTVCNGLQILRTQFLQTEDGYMQVVLRNYSLPFKILDSSATLNFENAAGQLRLAWFAANERHLFRPVEVTVLRTNKEDVMILNIFHGIYDGNCLEMMIRCVYDAYTGNGVLEFGPAFHDALIYGPLRTVQNAKTYWASRIGPPVAERLDVSGQHTQETQSIECGGRLETCRRSLNVTHQAVLQAAWITTLAQIYHQEQVSTGVVCSGRSIDFNDAAKVIGPMFNTIPFQERLLPNDSWSSLIHRCHKFNVDSLPYQHTSLREIQKWIRNGDARSLFASIFAFNMETSTATGGFDNELWSLQDDDNRSEYILALEVENKLNGSVRVLLASTGDTVNGASIRAILDQFQINLRHAMESSESLISTDPVKWDRVSQVFTEKKPLLEFDQSPSSKFTWNSIAKLIRAEISFLTGVREDDITEHTSIFELGLDSIDAIKLSARLAKRSIHIPVSSIMRYAKLVDIVCHASERRGEIHDKSKVLEEMESKLSQWLNARGKVLTNTERILPATSLQEAMVSIMVESDYRQYFNHDVLRLLPETNEERLRSAWKLVFEKTPILRTSFIPINDTEIQSTYAQVVMRAHELPWNTIHLEHATQIERVIEKLRVEAKQSGESALLFRLTLIRAEDENFLVLSLPHALYDGYSLNMLHSDLAEAYHSDTIEERPFWDKALEEILVMTNSSASEEFWSRCLSGSTPCLISNIPLSPSAFGHTVHRHEAQSQTTSEELRQFCKQQGITPQAFGQACFALVLASYTKRLDPVFGSVLFGRNTDEAQQLFFPMMNTVAVTPKLGGTKSSFMRSVQRLMTDILAHQYFPLRRAQRFASSDGKQLFNSLFIFQSRRKEVKRAARLYESVESSSDLEIPVCVELELIDSSILWRAACHSEFLDKCGTKQLLLHMEIAAKHLMRDVDTELIRKDENEVVIGSLPKFCIEFTSEESGVGIRERSNNESHVTVDPLIKTIQQILSQVAQVPIEDIGLGTTLYHIGLDSISAIKVCSLLRSRGITITVSNLLRASDLAGIAKAVTVPEREDPGNDATDEVIALAKAALMLRIPEDKSLSKSIDAILPATSGQIYMLKMWERSFGRLFFDTFNFKLRISELSPNYMKNAILRWVRSHPSLRTLFVRSLDKRMPVLQIIVSTDNVGVEEKRESVDIGTKDASSCAGSFQINVSDEVSIYGFYIPLIIYYERSESDLWNIGVHIHHALYDGVSLPALLRDLEALLKGTLTASSLQSLSNYSNFVARSHRLTQNQEARNFWTNYLSGTSCCFTSQKATDFDYYHKRFAKYHSNYIKNAQQILDAARRHVISVPSLFLAAYARLLHNSTPAPSTERGEKTASIAIGLYMANRGHGAQDISCFPTVNLLPLAVNTSLPLLEAAKKVQADLITISELPNASVGLWQIRDWTGVAVRSFVNWIHLPSYDDERSGNLDNFSTKNEINQLIENDATDFSVPEELQTDELLEAYLPTVDLEVALRGGALDLGIFGPTAMLEQEQAEELLSKIKEELYRFVGSE